MIGKMILPVLGGSPAVWNTCMVFFQAALLAGYLYVHVTTTWLGVRRQALLVLTLGCAVLAWRALPVSASDPIGAAPAQPTIATVVGDEGGHRRGQRWRWLALAFVPSSLMLGVTTYLTTDIAAIPLLWVLPLAIYLLSFILVFARRPWLPHALLCRALPPVLLCLVFLMVSGGTHELQTGMVMLIH